MVARNTREIERAIEESGAKAMPSGGGVNEQDPQLRSGVVVGVQDTEDRSNAATVELGDPCPLPLTVVVVGVVGDDFRPDAARLDVT